MKSKVSSSAMTRVVAPQPEFRPIAIDHGHMMKQQEFNEDVMQNR